MIFDLGCYASIALCGRTFAALLRRGFACGFYMQASFRIKDRQDGVRRWDTLQQLLLALLHWFGASTCRRLL